MAVPVLVLVSLLINRSNSSNSGLLPYAFFLLCPLVHLFTMSSAKNASKEEKYGKEFFLPLT
jgi:hypothetical protein